MPIVRKERTNWRDPYLDELHNNYNYDIPCENVEFLMVEYDLARPVAIVDYRYNGNNNPASEPVRIMCDSRDEPIPYIIVNYYIDDSINVIASIDVHCVNDVAMIKIGDRNNISENDFVELLYSIREERVPGRAAEGRRIAASLSRILSITQPSWKGQVISSRHRDWGWNVPVADLDFIVVNNGIPKAIIEYKECKSAITPYKFKECTTGKNMMVLCNELAEPIPAMIVYYDENGYNSFKIFGLNDDQFDYSSLKSDAYSRNEYFEFLKNL